MPELDAFERSLEAAFQDFADRGVAPVDTVAFAERVAGRPRTRRRSVAPWPRPRVAWVFLAAVLLLAALVAVAVVGGWRADRRLAEMAPAVVASPPVAPPSAGPPAPPSARPASAGVVMVEPGSDVAEAAFAPDGSLWTVGFGSVIRYDLEAGTATAYGRSDGLPAYMEQLVIAGDGTVWVGGWLDEVGLARFADGRWTAVATPDSLDTGDMGPMAVAPDGSLWVVANTDSQRLLWFDGTWHATPPQPEFTGHVPWAGSPAVTPDGTVWVSSAHGLDAYHEGTWSARPEAPDGQVTVTPDGALWVAGTNWYSGPTESFPPDVPASGVARFDGMRWATYTVEDGLADNGAELHVGADGTVWATHDDWVGKVSRFDGARWMAFPADGITSNVAVAADGSLWAVTAGGATRYDGTGTTTASLPVATLPAARSPFTLERIGEHQGSTPLGDIAWRVFRPSASHELSDLLATPHGLAGLDGNDLRWSADGETWEGTALSIRPFGLVPAGDDIVVVGPTGAVRLTWNGRGWAEADRLEIEGQPGAGIDEVVFGPRGAVITTGFPADPQVLYSSDGHRFRPAETPPSKARLATLTGSVARSCNSPGGGSERIGPVFATPDGFVALTASHPEDWASNHCAPVPWFSEDGSHWRLVGLESPFGAGSEVLSVSSAGGRYVAIGGIGVPRDAAGAAAVTWVSTDGLSWTRLGADAASPVINNRGPWEAEGNPVVSDLGFMAHDESGALWASPDGVTWGRALIGFPGLGPEGEFYRFEVFSSDVIVLRGEDTGEPVIAVGTVQR